MPRQPKKLSYADMEARVRYLERENYLLLIGFNDAMARAYDATTRWLRESPTDPGEHKFFLIRATSPGGGFIIRSFRYPGQRTTSTVQLWSDFFTDGWYHRAPPAFREALEDLRTKYHELIAEEERQRQAVQL